jgi:hypothetical protein
LTAEFRRAHRDLIGAENIRNEIRGVWPAQARRPISRHRYPNPFEEFIDRTISPFRHKPIADQRGRLIATVQFRAMAVGALPGVNGLAAVGLLLCVDAVPDRARCLRDGRESDRESGQDFGQRAVRIHYSASHFLFDVSISHGLNSDR